MYALNLKQLKRELNLQGILKPLSQEAKFRFPFGVYDIETPGIDSLEFYSCGFFDGKEYQYFRSMAEFLNYILSPYYSGWRFFAHFGGRFDVHYVFDWIMEHAPKGMELYISCAGSAVIGMTIKTGRNWWRFTDSYRLFPQSLATLTYDFDVEHKKIIGGDFKDRKYNEHDCLGLYEVLMAGFAFHDICSETAASHAMRTFRKEFLKNPVYQPHREIEEFCRRGYFGGRCEVYRYNKAQLNHYDVNSLFPTAMLHPVPVEYLHKSRKLTTAKNKIGFYHAAINYPSVYLPFLPVKVGKLFFPTGKFEGVFTGMELERAIADGAEVKIVDGCIFKAEPILADYSKELFKMKKEAEKEGQGAKRYVMKRLLNSLYGKFGQRREQRTYCLDDGTEGIFPLPGGLAYKVEESRAAHIMPQISATITSRARIMQAELLRASPNWYTDTDSLFTSGEYPTGVELGELHFEGRGDFQAYGLKEYYFNGDYKVKGLPRSKDPDEAKRREENNRVCRLYLLGQEMPGTRMIGFPEALRKGEKSVMRVNIVRRRREVFPKRCRDGDDTRPWDISEIREEHKMLKNHRLPSQNDPEKSLIQAIGFFGYLNSNLIKDSGTWGEWKLLPPAVKMQILRKSSKNSPDEIVTELAGIGYAWINSENDLLEQLFQDPYQSLNPEITAKEEEEMRRAW